MKETLESKAAPRGDLLLAESREQTRILGSIDAHKEEQEKRDIKLHEFIVESHAFIVKKENQASRATWMQVLIGVIALGLATASLNSENSVTEVIRYAIQKAAGLF